MLRLHAPRFEPVKLAAGLLSLIIGLGLVSSGFLAVLGGGLILWGLAPLRRMLRGPSLTAEQTTAGLDGMREARAHDPQPRCATHVSYPSLGSCPRCGTFVCAACISIDGLSARHPCLACRSRPEASATELDHLRRSIALRLLLGPAALIGILEFLVLARVSRADDVLWAKVGTAGLCAPWLLLCLLQLFVRNLWPGLASAGVWLATACLVPAIFQMGAQVVLLNWAVALWPAIWTRLSRKVLAKPIPLVRLSG